MMILIFLDNGSKRTSRCLVRNTQNQKLLSTHKLSKKMIERLSLKSLKIKKLCLLDSQHVVLLFNTSVAYFRGEHRGHKMFSQSAKQFVAILALSSMVNSAPNIIFILSDDHGNSFLQHPVSFKIFNQFAEFRLQ